MFDATTAAIPGSPQTGAGTAPPAAAEAHHGRSHQHLGGLVALMAIAIDVGGCAQPPWPRPWEPLLQQGHAATVECLLGERAITGGDELRCEDWAYVRDNYLSREE